MRLSTSLTIFICLPNAYSHQGWSQRRSSLAYTVPSSIKNDSIEKLRSLAVDLNSKSPTGVFILEPEPKDELQKAVSELEAICGPPSEDFRKSMVGDWKLLCTMNTPKVTTPAVSKLPFQIPEFLRNNPLQEKIQESVEVVQRIRCIEDDNYIDRVDNVIEFTPFSLEDVVSSASLNLNPLEVSKSKVTLAHKAEVQSIKPVLRTKIALQSVILNVAGKSQYLDPSGADVLSFNLFPIGDFLNAGSFDTTYVDDNIRVSRGSAGLFNQLRVFVRKDSSLNNVLESEEEDEVKDDDAEIISNEDELETTEGSEEDELEEDDSVEANEKVTNELDIVDSTEDEPLNDTDTITDGVEELIDDGDDNSEKKS